MQYLQRLRPAVRRTLIRHVVLTVLVATALSGLTLLGASAAAADEAQRTAERVSRQVASALAARLAEPDYRAPADDLRATLQSDLSPFLAAGIARRVKVWLVDDDGARIVVSDEARIEGATARFDPALLQRLDRGEVVVMTLPGDDEHRYEFAARDRLLEVFLGFTDSAGNRMLLEVYVPVDVAESARRTRAVVLPAMLIAVLGIAVATVPLSVRLVRRMERDERERHEALRYGLAASDRERQELAQRLHDGVIQDLAGAGMLLDAMRLAERRDPHPDGRHDLLDRAHRLVEHDVHRLRDLATDLLPAAVGEDLRCALADLVSQLRPHDAEPRLEVDVRVRSDHRADPETVLVVIRVARELLRNAIRHSRAGHVEVSVADDGADLVLTVSDDGIGFDVRGRARDGHIGLILVRRAVEASRGRIDVMSSPARGTTVTVAVPRYLR
jgi:signal transduction histidine kinase